MHIFGPKGVVFGAEYMEKHRKACFMRYARGVSGLSERIEGTSRGLYPADLRDEGGCCAARRRAYPR